MTYLFRGKVIGSDQWVYGSLLNRVDSIGPLSLIEVQDKEPPFEIKTFHVYPGSVGMWTGLKDKNGKEVFDGDLIKFHYWSTYEQRSFPEYVDFRETDMKEAHGVVYWNESELSWHVKPNDDSMVYHGSANSVRLEDTPLVYTGLTMEAISEWVGEYESSEEDLKQYTGRDGIEIISNIHLLNPAKGAVINTMNNFDPNEKQATNEEVKAEGQEIAAVEQEAQEKALDAEEGSTEG